MSESSDRDTRRRFTRREALGYFTVGATALVAGCAQPPAAAPSASAAASSSAAAKPGRWGMTPAQEAAWQQIEAAARKEGKLTYYSVGAIPANQVDQFKALWKKDYPEIEIDHLNPGNNVVVTSRIITEQESKTYVGDVANMGTPANIVMKPEMLEAFIPPTIQDPGVKWTFDPIVDEGRKGLVTRDFAQYFAIWTNSKLVSAADAPKNLLDVATNPKWKGQVIWRTPWTQGGGAHVFRFGKEVYGPDWLTKMQAQAPVFVDDQDAALLQVARGEFAIGIGLTGRTASSLIKAGQPIAAVWPNDFQIAVTNGTIILAHAPHPNAAKVFVNWMHTQAGQTLWRDLGQFPLRSDILPTDQWMQGASKATKVYENLAPEAQQKANLDEATRLFKR